MAFFRNYSSETVSQSVLDEKGQGQSIDRVYSMAGNDYVDGTLSDKDLERRTDGQCQSDGEPDAAIRLQDEAATDNGRMPNLQPFGRRTALAGKWGSTFWKDCQPMRPLAGSESGQESKSGSDYKNDEGSGDDSSDNREDRLESEDDDGQKKVDKVQRGHVDVPADEMLSDDYYEQDGDDQSDSLHYRMLHHSSGFNSKPQSRPVAAKNSVSRNSKASNGNKYDDADADYEDDDEEDEDDPDDADFDPDYGATATGRTGYKCQDEDWDAEDSDEDDNGDDDDEDDLDISDEDGSYYRKSRGGKRGKGGRSIKSTRELKSYTSSSRRKRGRSSFEEEGSSAKDTENESDEDFRSMTRRGAYLRKNNGGRSTSANISRKLSELRTSSRSVRKVSYAESEESEELDEGKKKRSQKEELEEEDGDSIEKVLWHQPKGMAEEALRNNKSTEPLLLSHLFDSEPDWNEMEFFIKWKGQSHLHCQWKSFSELQNLSGFKKVINYTKKVTEDVKYRKAVSREEVTSASIYLKTNP